MRPEIQTCYDDHPGLMKKIFVPGLAAAAVSALCLCAAVPASGPPPGAEPVFPLVEDFRVAFEGDLLGRPLALGKEVLLSASPNRVLAVGPAAKKILWQFTAKAALAAPAAAGDGFAVVFDQDGRMTRLSGDGKAVWERPIAGALSAPPFLVPGEILAVFDHRTVRSFDAATGAEKWSWAAEEDIRGGPRSWAGKIILLTASKKALLLTPGGKAASVFETAAPSSGSLLVSGARMFAGLANGTVEAWDLTKMKRRWTVKTGASLAADPVSDGKRIFFATEGRQLFALDEKRGNVSWWQNLPGRSVGETLVCGTQIVGPALSSALTPFDRATGKKGEAVDLKQDVVAPPLVLGGRLAVAVRDPVSLAGTLVFLKSRPAPPPPELKKKTFPGVRP